MNNDLARRCVWIQNLSSEHQEQSTNLSIIEDNDRRVKNLHKELLTQLPENQIFSSTFVSSSQREQLLTALSACLSNILENIFEDYESKSEIPYCTYGVDRRLLLELEETDHYIKSLTQNRANFKLLDNIKT